MSRTYLYGIIGTAEEAVLGITGADGVSPVQTVARQGLACVVSRHAGEAFGALSKENLVRILFAHQRAVERVMEQHTVLPVKFGTLLDGPREVEALLSQGRRDFVSALAFIQDKVEMEVAATWDTGRVLQEISGEEEVVRARAALLAEPEQQTLEQRVRLGQIVKACMDRRRDSYRERMVNMLKPLAVAVVSNVLFSDAMVMNVAFLVDRARLREFEEGVHQLDHRFENAVTFRLIGPLPPYSFSTVEIARLSRQEVKEARQTLRLGEAVSEEAVRKAYRRMAAEAQRTAPRNTEQGTRDKGLAQAQPARLWQASEVLLRYCRARSGAQGEKDSNGPAGQDMDCLFSIAIKGTGSDDIAPARFGKAEKVGAA